MPAQLTSTSGQPERHSRRLSRRLSISIAPFRARQTGPPRFAYMIAFRNRASNRLRQTTASSLGSQRPVDLHRDFDVRPAMVEQRPRAPAIMLDPEPTQALNARTV